MKLHFYEKENKDVAIEFVSEGEFHFVKKVKPDASKKKTRFIMFRR